MEIGELLERLDQHRGSFPENLIAETIARREEIIPLLLETIEDIDRYPEPWLADQKRMTHIYAFYLLAFFRETRAYPILVRIFSRPGEFPFDLAGDVITQDLGRILASVSGGAHGGMAELIENEQANEYVRAVAMRGMVSLVTTGQRTREEVMAYFLQLFEKLERNPGAQWDGLANVCADLWPQEALEKIRCAYKHELVDPLSIDLEDIEESLELGKQGAMQRGQYREPLIGNLSEAMGWMQHFHKAERGYKPARDAMEDLLDFIPDSAAPASIRRLEPKIGRNDPCPCGSGKKFKKCCGLH